ncbi:hypothetical protein [Anaerocolumna jejuensis]
MRGFTKVFLQPGETKRCPFALWESEYLLAVSG